MIVCCCYFDNFCVNRRSRVCANTLAELHFDLFWWLKFLEMRRQSSTDFVSTKFSLLSVKRQRARSATLWDTLVWSRAPTGAVAGSRVLQRAAKCFNAITHGVQLPGAPPHVRVAAGHRAPKRAAAGAAYAGAMKQRLVCVQQKNAHRQEAIAAPNGKLCILTCDRALNEVPSRRCVLWWAVCLATKQRQPHNVWTFLQKGFRRAAAQPEKPGATHGQERNSNPRRSPMI
jgi:hypothetical protein